VRLFIQPDTASVSADRPVFILVMVNLSGAARTVTAFRAVMCFPLCALRANSVRASKIFCLFFTAVLAHLAIGTDFHAVFTFAALHTESGAVGAVFTAVDTDVIRTVTAIAAVTAHDVGTVNANAAVGTEFIHTSGAFAAVLADAFRAVRTDDTAALTDLRAVAALPAILAEQILCAFPADIAGSTEFVRAVGAFLATVRTEIRTVFASLAAGTYCSAVGAESAGNAEAVRASTVNACAAFRTHLSVRAVQAFFTAFLADDGAVRASAAADTDRVNTVVANAAVGTEVFFSGTVFADTALRTKLIIRTFTAFLVTFGTDSLYTLRAPASADTNKFRAHLAGFAVIAEVSVTACAILTDVASTADFFLGTVCTLFVAVRTDCRTP